MLEDANIKLSGVVKDINGLSSRILLAKIIEGEKPNEDEVKNLIFGSMHKKLDQIMPAIDEIISLLQRRLFASILNHIDDMTRRINDMDEIIKDYLHEYEQVISAIDKLPGIGHTSAEAIIAEIGKDMCRFPIGSTSLFMGRC